MIIGKMFWIKEMKYKSWMIYLIFLSTSKQQTENQSSKVKNTQKFLSNPHFSMINSLSVVARKSGCDRPTPLTRISSPRFPN